MTLHTFADISKKAIFPEARITIALLPNKQIITAINNIYTVIIAVPDGTSFNQTDKIKSILKNIGTKASIISMEPNFELAISVFSVFFKSFTA